MSDTPDSPVFDAATVIVLREAERGRPEIFMVRRHGKASFMANAYVYPGGRLDPEDCDPQTFAHVEGLTPEAARERLEVDSPNRAVGLYLAAIRESFEEAGVLLARRRGEAERIDLTGEEAVARRFAGYRQGLASNEQSLSEVAEAESLVFPIDELAYFAHWITPTFEPKRFDTYFFLARMPQNQAPLHDAAETTDSLWITAAEALERSREGGFFLAPPTYRTLEQIAAHDSVDAAFEVCAERRPPAILPHFVAGEQTLLLLPGDPEYPAELAEYAAASPVDDRVTRMTMVEGAWRSSSA